MNHGDTLLSIIGNDRIAELREAYITKHGGVVPLLEFSEALRSNLVALGLNVKAKERWAPPKYQTISTMGEQARAFYRDGELWRVPPTLLTEEEKSILGDLAFVRSHEGLLKAWTLEWLSDSRQEFKALAEDHYPPEEVLTELKAAAASLVSDFVLFPNGELCNKGGGIFPRELKNRRDRVPYVVFRENLTKIEVLTQPEFDAGKASGEPILHTAPWRPVINAFARETSLWRVAKTEFTPGGFLDEPVGLIAISDMGWNLCVARYCL